MNFSVYNPILVPLLYFVLLLLSHFFCKFSGFFKLQVAAEMVPSRYLSLDGFRGVLAFLVVYHHLIIAYRYHFLDGAWKIPDSRFYTLIGQGAVAGFFMMTAFLFWGRILNKGDFGAVKEFYVARLNRVLPAFLTSVALIFFVVGWETNWVLSVDFNQLIEQVSAWLALGFLGAPDINGLKNTGVVNAYVFWTLKYEALFYLLLPFFSVFILRWYFLVLGLLVYYFIGSVPDYFFINYFFLGAIVAFLYRVEWLRVKMQGIVGLVVLLVGLSSFYVLSDSAYSLVALGPMFLIFFPVALGQDFFGGLSSVSARMIGLISYSMYLLHGIVIYVIFTQWKSIDLFLLKAGLVFAIVYVLSVCSFRFIEYPFFSKK